MKVKFKKFNENARIPEKAHNDDYGYDVYAVSEEEIFPGVWKYGLGFGVQMVPDWETVDSNTVYSSDSVSGRVHKHTTHQRIDFANSPMDCCISLRPRSSIYKTGMVLANAVPTIDKSYTGEISLIFYHVMKNLPRYKVGDKIAQMYFDCTFSLEFEDAIELDKTERGNGGFGSTGK